MDLQQNRLSSLMKTVLLVTWTVVLNAWFVSVLQLWCIKKRNTQNTSYCRAAYLKRQWRDEVLPTHSVDIHTHALDYTDTLFNYVLFWSTKTGNISLRSTKINKVHHLQLFHKVTIMGTFNCNIRKCKRCLPSLRDWGTVKLHHKAYRGALEKNKYSFSWQSFTLGLTTLDVTNFPEWVDGWKDGREERWVEGWMRM